MLRIEELCLKTLGFLARRFFILLLFIAAAICFFIWFKFVWKANWDESKKQQYVNEQAKFSFDKQKYKKTVETIKTRRDKFENDSSFSGRDIFFPEGW